MQTRLDAAREKLRVAQSSATEQRMNAKRAAKAFDAAERKRKGAALALDLDAVADPDATGALDLRVHAERDPLLSVISGR